MPNAVASIFIPLPIEQVYYGSKDVKSLERFLPEVKKITTLEESPTRTVNRFEWSAMGKRVVQIEVEEWDDATFGNRFYQQEGDFDEWQGRYLYTAVEGGTEFTIDLNWQLSLPLIGPLLNKMIGKIVEGNVNGLLRGVKEICLEKAKAAT
jgi:coenzyme Q-binding protein COQ10